MLSLYYKKDDIVEIEGKQYKVNAAFDNILTLIDLLNEKKLPDHRKVVLGIKLLLGQEVELDIVTQSEIFNQIFEVYVNEGPKNVELDLRGNPMPTYKKDRENFYSLQHDADYIFAAFMQAYRINLIKEQGKLHWFDFQALLAGLPDDTKFRQIISIRTWKKPSKNDSEAKRMSELQRIFELPGEEVT